MSEQEHLLSVVIVFGEKRIEEKSNYPPELLMPQIQ